MKTLAGALMVSLLAVSSAAGETGSHPARVNPHSGTGNCHVCHVATEADLGSRFTSPSVKKKLLADSTRLCRQCHGVAFGHGVGKTPAMNRRDLPLDADGKIACAMTCHNIHVKSDDPVQSRYHLRLTRDELCLSCHKG